MSTSQGVPEAGAWKMVPVEPTDKMVEAARNVYAHGPDGMRAAFKAALAASPSPHPGVGAWRDMSTAPLDGTKVDVWVRPWDAFANGNPARITDAWFEGGKWKRVIAGWTHNIEASGEPTHWMPRPTEPGSAPHVGVEVMKLATKAAEHLEQTARFHSNPQLIDEFNEMAAAVRSALVPSSLLKEAEEAQERERNAQAILARIRKVRDGYVDQARFADVDPASYFREFVRRLDAAVDGAAP